MIPPVSPRDASAETCLIAPKSGCMTIPWIHTRRWDLTWIVGSALVVPIVLAVMWAGASSAAINLGVTVLVGGPHLFATYLAALTDSRFRRSRARILLTVAVLGPAVAICGVLFNFQILLSVFLFSASVHVLHQNAYLTDIYRAKSGGPGTVWPRLIDYGLLMFSIYPVAAHKLVQGNFMLGEIEILIPGFLKSQLTCRTVWIVFAFFLAAWLAKTVAEYRSGRLNGPKTLLIGVTTVIAFLVPAAAGGARLELAFQSVNAWHSIQYLGLVWYVQNVRKNRGLIESAQIAKLSGTGVPAAYFYGACLLTTLTLLAVLVALNRIDPFRWLGITVSFQQYYYMGMLSCLLIHYAIDGYLFTISNRRDATVETSPYAALS